MDRQIDIACDCYSYLGRKGEKGSGNCLNAGLSHFSVYNAAEKCLSSLVGNGP